VAVVETESDEVNSEFVEAITEFEVISLPQIHESVQVERRIDKPRKLKTSHWRDVDNTAAKSLEQETRLSEEGLASIVQTKKNNLLRDRS
jgi:hypothetical protein